MTLIIPKCSNLSISFWMTFFCSSLIGYGHTKKGVSSFNLRWISINGHVPTSSLRLKTSWKSSVLVRNSSLPLSSSNESSKFNLCLNISASFMCLCLSSGSSHEYLSSLVGTLVSSVIVSVHVDINGLLCCIFYVTFFSLEFNILIEPFVMGLCFFWFLTIKQWW